MFTCAWVTSWVVRWQSGSSVWVSWFYQWVLPHLATGHSGWLDVWTNCCDPRWACVLTGLSVRGQLYIKRVKDVFVFFKKTISSTKYTWTSGKIFSSNCKPGVNLIITILIFGRQTNEQEDHWWWGMEYLVNWITMGLGSSGGGHIHTHTDKSRDNTMLNLSFVIPACSQSCWFFFKLFVTLIWKNKSIHCRLQLL